MEAVLIVARCGLDGNDHDQALDQALEEEVDRRCSYGSLCIFLAICDEEPCG
jgi:hypothetical protein